MVMVACLVDKMHIRIVAGSPVEMDPFNACFRWKLFKGDLIAVEREVELFMVVVHDFPSARVEVIGKRVVEPGENTHMGRKPVAFDHMLSIFTGKDIRLVSFGQVMIWLV